MKKKLWLIGLIVALVMMVGGCSKSPETVTETSTSEAVESEVVDTESKDIETTSPIKFTDDSDREITLEKPAEKVISLYSVHTENLYALGAGDMVIGVGMSDKYPEEVSQKIQYSYKDDPELVIAANPDVLIIRTMIEDRYADYIKAIEDAGITVVNLYCSTYDDFDAYMVRLGMIVGKEQTAKDLVAEFHQEIDTIKAKSAKIEIKQNAYFESMGNKFKTVTPNSFAGTALSIVGVNNVAADVDYDNTSTVVTYGEETLLSKSDEIEIYIAQKGAMNKTVSVEEIKARPGFDGIKAVKEDHVIVIDEKLISGATMRYLQGLKLLQKEIYGIE